jgi:hypothetical protein
MSQPSISRVLFTIVQHPQGWTVEQGVNAHPLFKTKEEAMASATRLANASQNAGHPAQIRFADEPSFTRG